MENEIIIAAAKKIGRKEQINIAIEELSELIQALCKLNRKGSEVEHRCRRGNYDCTNQINFRHGPGSGFMERS